MSRILVVDDNKIHLLQAKQILSDYFEVSTVISGIQALKFLDKKDVDLIILDIEMPVMDGRQTLAELRNNPKTARIPVIFLSATSDTETEATCFQLGAIDFITKPLVPQAMLTRVTKALELIEQRKTLEKNVKHYMDIATSDSLTGLYNRAHFVPQMTEALRENNSGALIILDIDRFKKINDTMGHITGDEVLASFGRLLSEMFSDSLVARIGGDEFVVFSQSNATPEYIKRRLDTLTVRADEFFKESTDGIGALSAGIAFSPEHGTDFTSLYSCADKALYYTKPFVKSSYCIYNSTMESSAPQEVDITSMKNMLNDGEAPQGALQKDFDAFLQIYRFVGREERREDKGASLMLITLRTDNEVVDKLTREEYMEMLSKIIKESMRMGDVYTRCSDSQYMALFPQFDINSGPDVIMNRIRMRFKNLALNDNVRLCFESEQIKN